MGAEGFKLLKIQASFFGSSDNKSEGICSGFRAWGYQGLLLAAPNTKA